ncbi:50S ribosomal protein L29 [bacterium]|nr:50S ribosomal protein L29 [candidate division CSSED10-310 bacterium]
MKISDIREMSLEELALKLSELQELMFRYRFQSAMGQLDNPIKIRNARRDIARIQTVITENKNKSVTGTVS